MTSVDALRGEFRQLLRELHRKRIQQAMMTLGVAPNGMDVRGAATQAGGSGEEEEGVGMGETGAVGGGEEERTVESDEVLIGNLDVGFMVDIDVEQRDEQRLEQKQDHGPEQRQTASFSSVTQMEKLIKQNQGEAAGAVEEESGVFCRQSKQKLKDLTDVTSSSSFTGENHH